MSYHFTKGHYRAYVSTRYYDHNDQQQFVNGDPVEFDADPVEYFEFETNENIKVNLATLEPPEGATELLSEGDDHGIHYKLYENSLAILTGTQTSDFGEEGWPEWCECSYIYAEVILQSGWVFKTSDSVELQIRNSSFKSGATSAHLFNHGGVGWQVLNIEGLDTSNLSDFSRMFANLKVTGNLKGLNALDFSNGNNFEGFMYNAQFYTNRVAIDLHLDTLSIDPTGTNHKFDNAFSGTVCVEDSGEWPYGLFVHITSVNNKTMFRWSDEQGANYYSGGKLRVFIENSDYATPNMPADSSYMFYGNKNSRGIYLSGFVAPDNCDMSHFLENTSAQYIYFKTETGGDESNATKRATNMTAFCKNNANLLEPPRSLRCDELLYADEMYYGCTNLGYSSSSYVSTSVSGGGPKVISAKKMFYGALTNWGSRPQLMDVYLTVSGTDDVDCSELLSGAGIGYRGGIELYLTAQNNHANGKTVSLEKAFYQTGVRNINVYSNRGSTGESYLTNVSMVSFLENAYIDSSVCMYNLYITNLTNAFKNCHEIKTIAFYDEDVGGIAKSWCSLPDSVEGIANMLIGVTTDLEQFYSPNNMLNIPAYNYNYVILPRLSDGRIYRYYKNGQWHNNSDMNAKVSLACYQPYTPE